MAAAAPTTAELQALILQLQTEVTTLTSGAATAGPAPAAICGSTASGGRRLQDGALTGVF